MPKRSFNRREFMKVGAVSMLGSTFTLGALGEMDTRDLEKSLSSETLEQLKSDALTLVSVDTVHCDQPNNIPVIQISDEEGHQLHIYVGVAEGNAIRMALENQSTPRPMTHDLMQNLVETGGMQVECTVITKLEQTTFHAMMILRSQGELQAVDCRPSDAIALCLRTRSPIYANRALFNV